MLIKIAVLSFIRVRGSLYSPKSQIWIQVRSELEPFHETYRMYAHRSTASVRSETFDFPGK